MKYLIVLLAVVMTACASTTPQLATSNNKNPSQEVHVTGVGKTVEEAKQNGFKIAIEYVVGTVLVTEKEANNNQLIKNQIINYSAGYVDNYKILSQTVTNNNISLSMNVTVKSSHIAEMILGEKSRTKLEGDSMVSKYESLLNLRVQQEKLLDNVLDNYYDQGIVYKVGTIKYKYDSSRNLILTLPQEKSSNQNYYKALDEVLKLLADGDSYSLYKIELRVNPNHNKIFSQLRMYSFTDERIYNKVQNFDTGLIVLKFLDSNNNTVYSTCFHNTFHLLSGNIEKDDSWEDELKFNPKSPAYQKIKSFDHVEMSGMRVQDAYKNKSLCQG